jgi:hypothetical protein
MILGGGPGIDYGHHQPGGRNVSGTISGRSLTFQRQILDDGDQFIGGFYEAGANYTGPYRGARHDQPRPSPCIWP